MVQQVIMVGNAQGPDGGDGDERVLYCDRAPSPHHQQDFRRAQGQPSRDVTTKELLFTHSFLHINKTTNFAVSSKLDFFATRASFKLSCRRKYTIPRR